MVSKQSYELGAKSSTIRELFEYGKKLAKEIGPENVLDFSIGNPSTPAPPAVREAILQLLEEEDDVTLNGYTSATGDEGARKAIADSLNRRFGTSYDASQLFICSGAAPALVGCLRALIVDETSEIVAIAPYFPEYRVFTECNGGKLVVVPADIPSFQVDMAALSERINKNTQAIIINSPNNPSGVVYSEETLVALAALLRDRSKEYGHPIYLISDEPYRELVYGADVPWVPSIYENTIVCYSYSKSLSLPGQRLGWVLVPDTVADRAEVWCAIAGGARACGHVCASSLYQRVIGKCADVQPDLEIYQANRDLLYNGLTEMGYTCAHPDGAFYLFLQAPDGNSEDFSDRAKQLGMLITPGTDFGCPSYLRVSYCVPTARIEKALPLFKKLIG